MKFLVCLCIFSPESCKLSGLDEVITMGSNRLYVFIDNTYNVNINFLLKYGFPETETLHRQCKQTTYWDSYQML